MAVRRSPPVGARPAAARAALAAKQVWAEPVPARNLRVTLGRRPNQMAAQAARQALAPKRVRDQKRAAVDKRLPAARMAPAARAECVA